MLSEMQLKYRGSEGIPKLLKRCLDTPHPAAGQGRQTASILPVLQIRFDLISRQCENRQYTMLHTELQLIIDDSVYEENSFSGGQREQSMSPYIDCFCLCGGYIYGKIKLNLFEVGKYVKE